MYLDSFDEIGSMPRSVRLSVNVNIQPHIDPPWKTPIVLKCTIKPEMRKNNIGKVIEPTDRDLCLAHSHKKRWESKNLPRSKTSQHYTQKTISQNSYNRRTITSLCRC